MSPKLESPEAEVMSDAEWRIDRFERRFAPSYRLLARYAAMPVVLTPELLGYLRTQLLRGQVDWIGEADLLLSDLCRPVGYEQYVLQPDVRAVLLAELEHQHPEVLERVARLLIQYFRYLARTNRYFTPREQQRPAWGAMLYIPEQRQRVADEIAAEFERVGTGLGEVALSGAARREMKRLNGIVQEFAPKLGDYPGLLAYAERVGRALREPQSLTPEEREQVFVVGDRQLHLPDGILTPTPPPGFPPLQTVGFDVATIADDTSPTPQPPPLRREPHVFEVATIALQELPIDRSRKKKKRQPQRLVSVQRDRRADWQYVATLGDGVELELVRIPGGSFPMGSPDTELERFDREGPQHRVTVAEFFMGKYAVTQSQWRVVAAMETVNRELDPNPSRFQGEDRPVERVSWLEAVEFCDRLSRHTGRTYRPPTEAEWEYACRAGTETPFHFGSTITPALANYNGNYTYADEPKGEYRGQTTPVGSFGVANSFGLYDIAIRSDL